MKIHKIYIIGKYRAQREQDKVANIERARQAAHELCRKGWFVFCPHANSGYFDIACPEISQEFWLAMGSAFQRDCEAVYLLREWQQSQGSLIEYRDAQAWEQMIFEQGRNEPPDLNKVMV